MSSIQLDSNLDLLITNNSLTLTTGAEAIRQHLQTKLGLFRGEWFLDTEIGVPWFRDILVKKPSFVVIQDVLKNEILSTPGVISLTRFKFDYNPSLRSAKLEFTVLTDEGFIDFSIPVDIGGGT